jgi:hypothetical protein
MLLLFLLKFTTPIGLYHVERHTNGFASLCVRLGKIRRRDLLPASRVAVSQGRPDAAPWSAAVSAALQGADPPGGPAETPTLQLASGKLRPTEIVFSLLIV